MKKRTTTGNWVKGAISANPSKPFFKKLLSATMLPLSLLLFNTAGAQQLELNGSAGTASFSTSANGPLPTSANANSANPLGGAATLYLNTGTSSTFTSYAPATTATVSFANQQYTSSAYPGLVVGALAVASNTTTMSGTNLFVPFTHIANPLAGMFTSAPDAATAGTNFSISENYGFRISTDAFYQAGQPLTARNYYGDVVITFSRPVVNPVIHVSGFGGAYINQILGTLGFYTELELSNADVAAGRTLTRLSGSTHMVLDAANTKILNDATAKDIAFVTSLYADNQQNAGAGSVILNTGSNAVTSVAFRVYLKGDGGTLPTAVWGEAGSVPGRPVDTWLLGVSLGAYTVSGNVFNDLNGLTDNTVNGAGTNAGGLYANLVDANGNVFATVAVAANGTYSFGNIISGAYNVVLTTAQPAAGSALSAATLPAGWISTGEHTGLPAGSDGTVNSIIPVTVGNANVTDINLGIEQPPTPGGGSNSANNPGGSIQVPVPANTFTNISNSTDPVTGTVTAILITGIPTGATTIVINGTTYGPGFTPFPAAGVAVPTDASGNPTQPITVDPTATGTTTVSIPFKAIDAAGAVSAATGTAVLIFTTAVPVMLISFTAVPEGRQVKVLWRTSSEINSSRFDVERAGSNSSFAMLQSAAAAGTSSTEKQYGITDGSPLGGTNYYRLKSINTDGSFAYSNVVSVTIKESFSIGAASPNPFTDNLSVAVYLEKAEQISILITDMTGRVIRMQSIKAAAGAGKITIAGLGKLATGIYLLKAATANHQLTQKVVKE